MSYNRVIPRDLFNEAKLLKCLGLLSLKLHDNLCNIADRLNIDHQDEKSGFIISQDDCGSIFVSNLYLYDNNGTSIHLSCDLNSRVNYPLTYEFKDHCDYVFDDDGNFTDAFKQCFLYSEGALMEVEVSSV